MSGFDERASSLPRLRVPAHWRLLGLDPADPAQATRDAVMASFRALVKWAHPDGGYTAAVLGSEPADLLRAARDARDHCLRDLRVR